MKTIKVVAACGLRAGGENSRRIPEAMISSLQPVSSIFPLSIEKRQRIKYNGDTLFNRSFVLHMIESEQADLESCR